MNVEDLKLELRNLTHTDLGNIKAHCEYLMNKGIIKKEEIKINSFGRDFYGVLSRVAESKGITFFPSYTVFLDRNIKGVENYAQQVAILQEWITNKFPDLNKMDTAFIKRLLARIYVMYMKKEYPQKLNFYIFINNLHRIPYAFELQFPGYIEHNLQNVIIKNRKT